MDENLRETAELPEGGETVVPKAAEPEATSPRRRVSVLNPAPTTRAASSSGFPSARRRASCFCAETIL